MATNQTRNLAFQIFVVALMVLSLASIAPAQQPDPNTIYAAFEAFFARGDYASAEREAIEYEQAIKSRRGEYHADYAVALDNLAKVGRAQGKATQAELLERQAFAIRQTTSYEERIQELRMAGRFSDAAPLAVEALNIRQKILGPDHPALGSTLYLIGILYKEQKRYTDAEPYYKKALAISEKSLGSESPEFLGMLNGLGQFYVEAGRYSDAEQVYKRSLAGDEKAFGPDSPALAELMNNNLAPVLEALGRYTELDQLLRRALAIQEKALPPGHPQITIAIHNLADACFVRGQYSDAERLFKRALAIGEKTFGSKDPRFAGSLHDLAALYAFQGRYSEAEALYRRASVIYENWPGNESPLAQTLSGLAALYQDDGRYRDAEVLLKRSLGLLEKAWGPDDPDVADVLNGLASLNIAEGRYIDAEPLLKRSLLIAAKCAECLRSARVLNVIAELYREQGRYADAAALYKTVLATWEKAVGSNNPGVAETLFKLASVYRAMGDTANALGYSRRATAAIIANMNGGPYDNQRNQGPRDQLKQRLNYFERHVSDIVAAADKGMEPSPSLGREAFEVAQWAVQSSAAVAIQQFALRLSAASNNLAALVREDQDLAAAWRGKDRLLVAALSRPDEQDSTTIDGLRKQIAEIDRRRAAIAAQLQSQFPNYSALTAPKPLSVENVQQLLGPNEALIFFLTGDKQSYVFALTREQFEWKAVSLSGNDISEKVRIFRQGLDVQALYGSGRTGSPALFDLGFANELYAKLLGPVEANTKEKSKILVVPTGALTALPFHLLVTTKPPVAKPQKMDGYRDASWLINRQSVDVLPSVSSLKALRTQVTRDSASKPMIGFGNPLFNPEQRPENSKRALSKSAKSETRRLATGSYSDFWQGAGIDRLKLTQALPPLPDTADELTVVARNLGAAASDIHLGSDASETTVKTATLSDFRVVYFATHGLVAGDVKGLAEPSLALSIPIQPTELDDGLLTASEVAELKLNADWVVLSACNTIAGDKPGAEALSGLARAFFYAGARALLVSHWAVDSRAAARLTSSTFDFLKKNSELGRADALRQAMLAYVNDTSTPSNAYPAFWGPFAIIGEGAGR